MRLREFFQNKYVLIAYLFIGIVISIVTAFLDDDAFTLKYVITYSYALISLNVFNITLFFFREKIARRVLVFHLIVRTLLISIMALPYVGGYLIIFSHVRFFSRIQPSSVFYAYLAFLFVIHILIIHFNIKYLSELKSR